MGGRGASMAMKRSPEYKEAYNEEMSFAPEFWASIALSDDVTKDSLGKMMRDYKSALGRSPIADTREEIDSLKRQLREANQVGASYGLTKPEIEGKKQGLREKIAQREKAVEAMLSARSEYEKYNRETVAANERAKKRKGRWL